MGYWIRIDRSRLTDGSSVYDVRLSEQGEEARVIFDCRDEGAAHAMAATIRTAIETCTNDAAQVFETRA